VRVNRGRLMKVGSLVEVDKHLSSGFDFIVGHT
jgi:hypothetical protein